MTCNDLHDSLVDIGEISCPFCNQKLDSNEKLQSDICCNFQTIINDNGMNVCESCGTVIDYDVAIEYIEHFCKKFSLTFQLLYYIPDNGSHFMVVILWRSRRLTRKFNEPKFKTSSRVAAKHLGTTLRVVKLKSQEPRRTKVDG